MLWRCLGDSSNALCDVVCTITMNRTVMNVFSSPFWIREFAKVFARIFSQSAHLRLAIRVCNAIEI